MYNDKARVFAELSDIMSNCSNNTGSIPEISRAIMTMAASTYCKAKDNLLDDFMQLVGGQTLMCKVHRMITGKPTTDYHLKYFKKGLGVNANNKELLNKHFWHEYLKTIKVRLASPEYSMGSISTYLRGGGGVTQYMSKLVVSDAGDLASVDIRYSVPSGNVTQVIVSHTLEEIESIDLTKLIGSNDLSLFNTAEFHHTLSEGVEPYLKDLPEITGRPEWFDLLVEGTYDDIVINVREISWDSQKKQPVTGRIAFRKDMDSRYICRVSEPLQYLIGKDVSKWEDLPYYLQRLLSQLDLDSVDSYDVDWYLCDNDIHPDNLTATPILV